jgi:hypothetical protein
MIDCNVVTEVRAEKCNGDDEVDKWRKRRRAFVLEEFIGDCSRVKVRNVWNRKLP